EYRTNARRLLRSFLVQGRPRGSGVGAREPADDRRALANARDASRRATPSGGDRHLPEPGARRAPRTWLPRRRPRLGARAGRRENATPHRPLGQAPLGVVTRAAAAGER